ncbi:extracellular solute-binding protein [Paenibacillus sp. HWE-109]|uniref:extracellular solute-binding protein n=1 Tax=Paenibacillus sp. HWE-109 TaxID=1306526 RepID=UPI001EDD4EA4|nr:extracellular solute-binding protein [Paenibacillus sp. HWE-109]UKS28316.1 extracellular solute-binding protein [Paenibacillus sp. HWE-109]
MVVLKKSATVVLAASLCISLAACSKSEKADPKASAAATAAPTSKDAAATAAPAKVTKLSVLLDNAMILGGYEKPEERLKQYDEDVKSGKLKGSKNDKMQFDNLKYLSEKMKSQNIELVAPDWGWAEPLIQKESAAFLAKDGPDIIVGETQMPGFALAGHLEPFPDALAAKIRASIAEAAWKPMEVNGKIYGLAPDPGVNILYWNKKIVKAAGLDPDKAPATWDELLANSKKIFESGSSAGGVYGGPNFGGYLRFGAFMKLAGGDYVDGKGAPTLNSPENEKAFEFLRQMNKYNKPGIVSALEEGTFFTAFDKGQIAYQVNGPWVISGCADQKVDCGVAPLPLGPTGKPGNVTIGAAFQAVPAYSKNKEAAFKVIEELMGQKIQQNIADAGVRAPILKSITESDAYKTAQPSLYIFAKGLQGEVVGLPTFAGDANKAWQAIGEAMTKTMLTDKPVKEILKAAQDQIVAAGK